MGWGFELMQLFAVPHAPASSFSLCSFKEAQGIHLFTKMDVDMVLALVHG